MSRVGFAHVRELLQSNLLIRRHFQQRERELLLFTRVTARLPLPIRSHVRDLVLSGGCLTLLVDSPVWATRVRYLCDDLQRSLAREGVFKIGVRARPPRDGRFGDDSSDDPGAVLRDPGGPKPGRLSLHVTRHLADAAEGMPDPILAEVFRRLARRHAPATPVTDGTVVDGGGSNASSRPGSMTPGDD